MINQTQQTLYRLDNLNTLQQKLTYQLSTGLKLQQGSDDSVLFAREVYVDDKIRTFEGLKNQIGKTTIQNNTADSSMAEIKNILEYVKSELIKANTYTTNDNGLSAIASAISGMKENLFDLANTQIEGEYVFAGSDSSVKPFQKNVDGTISYVGDNSLRKIAVEEGSYRERGINGFDVMMYSSSTAYKGETLTFKSSDRIIDQDGSEWILKDKVQSGGSVTFSSSQQLVDSNNTIWNLNTSTTPPQLEDAEGNVFPETVSFDGVSSYSVNVPSDTQLGVNEYVKYNVDGTISNPEEVLVPTYDSVDNTISLSIPNVAGNKFEAKTSIFDVMDKIVNALNKVDVNGDPISDEEARSLIASGLDEISNAYDSVNVAHADLGGKNKVFEVSLERVNSKLTQFNVLSQELGAADLTEVAMKAKSLELTYTALYSTISKTSQLSLVNFM